ncbi:hypothetical protein PACTADRAFT_41073 [Pachysolen tannophilus NRRL Y-2460]|uniref:Mannan endo-1,6-alpha-mannosidase n=1 Tax=Pachysolen tannophilus NRRL Y-2460 TaxID=669874 RepID=A0A1E4TWQ6_PACTA|nr:hypothetical protein PACTADRAFT_41073 [Pachysolen tannophilus NRRL Y-2460]
MWVLFSDGLTLDETDEDSICYAVSLVADGIMDYYEGTQYGGTIGIFQEPYYWWEAGEAWGGMIDMWYLCGNDTYEDTIKAALIAQTGSDYDYVPSNQSMTEGNDDQAFWGLAVMQATERNLSDPTGDTPGWLALTQAVFNTMYDRWDTSSCNGGLRWQIFTWNSGYDYKNSISNGGLFHIAARLARYTSNDTYADVAAEVWDWVVGVGFLVLDSDAYVIFDGADTGDNCTDIETTEWSYTYGLYLAGCAYLYNYTEDSEWELRAAYILNGASSFFNNSIMYEKSCQASGSCDNDERSFKSVFSRCLGLTSTLVPTLTDTIKTLLVASAKGAAESCSGGTDGHTCGLNWFYGSWDGWYGLGEQMSALEVFQSLLVKSPLTADTGGTSTGNADAGQSTSSSTTSSNDITVEKKDKVGAGILTAFVLAILFGGSIWMIL